jgi:hypothetical protein
MSEDLEKEAIFPCGSLDFVGHGYGSRMAADKVEGDASQDCEVLGSIVLSGSVRILREQDVEHPMQSVLDAPVTAHGVQQRSGCDVFGEQEVADDRFLCPPAARLSARGDAGEGANAWEPVFHRHAGIANDGGLPPFSPVVGRRLDPLGAAALATTGKAPHDGIEQLALVLLESQHEVGAPLQDLGGKGRLQ